MIDPDLQARTMRAFAPLPYVLSVWMWDEEDRVFVVVVTEHEVECASLERELNMVFRRVVTIRRVVSPYDAHLPTNAQQVL